MSKNASTPNSGPISKNPQLAEGQLEALFRRLNLAYTRRIYLAVVYWERSSKSPSSVAKSFLAEQFCKFSSSTLCITLY